jgi:hypothetical protein
VVVEEINRLLKEKERRLLRKKAEQHETEAADEIESFTHNS